MAATIMMPQQIDLVIREMCSDVMSRAVAALADKYGFDEKEANLFLAEGSAFASDAIFQDVVKVIAAHWKEENEETRPEWNAKAKTPATS